MDNFKQVLINIFTFIIFIIGVFLLLLSFTGFLMGDISFSLIIFFIGLILFFVSRNVPKKILNYVRQLRINLEEYSRKQREIQEEVARKERENEIQILQTKYGKFAESIYNKKLEIGMNLYMIKEILGEPGERKENVTKNKVTEKYLFLPYLNQRNNTSYKIEVSLENGLVCAWKEL